MSKLSKIASLSMRSRKNLDSKVDAPIDPDEELGLLVSQIEQNTFSILSMKQKFSLMEKNSLNFKTEATTKLDSFAKIVDDLERKTNATFESFSNRLDKMEVLSFRPTMFHPSKSILVNDNHEITSLHYTDDFIYIGTDSSNIYIYNTDTTQKHSEIGPLDSNAVINIGSFSFETSYVIAQTATTRIAYIHDIAKPGFEIKLNSNYFFVWSNNLSSKYKFGIIRDKDTWLYSNSFEEHESIPFSGSVAVGGIDCMVIVNSKIAKLIQFEETENVIQDFEFTDEIDHVAISRTFFCVSLKNSIAVCSFDGNRKIIPITGPTNFLMANDFYVFRISDEMLVEVYDITGKNSTAYIGSKDWSPHEGRDPPTAACFEESVLLTAKLAKCCIWS